MSMEHAYHASSRYAGNIRAHHLPKINNYDCWHTKQRLEFAFQQAVACQVIFPAREPWFYETSQPPRSVDGKASQNKVRTNNDNKLRAIGKLEELIGPSRFVGKITDRFFIFDVVGVDVGVSVLVRLIYCCDVEASPVTTHTGNGCSHCWR